MGQSVKKVNNWIKKGYKVYKSGENLEGDDLEWI